MNKHTNALRQHIAVSKAYDAHFHAIDTELEAQGLRRASDAEQGWYVLTSAGKVWATDEAPLPARPSYTFITDTTRTVNGTLTTYRLHDGDGDTLISDTDPRAFVRECRELYGIDVRMNVIETRAIEIFCTSYGLGLDDAFTAARFEARWGSARLARVLRLVAADGCGFDVAARAIEEVDSFLRAA